jgi:hypothetical protein
VSPWGMRFHAWSTGHGPYELDGAGRAGDGPLRWTRVARVDVDYFDALGTRVLNGRDFEPNDTAAGSRSRSSTRVRSSAHSMEPIPIGPAPAAVRVLQHHQDGFGTGSSASSVPSA